MLVVPDLLLGAFDEVDDESTLRNKTIFYHDKLYNYKFELLKSREFAIFNQLAKNDFFQRPKLNCVLNRARNK